MKHPVDTVSVGILKWGPKDVRFFTDGWGDDDGALEPFRGSLRGPLGPLEGLLGRLGSFVANVGGLSDVCSAILE